MLFSDLYSDDTDVSSLLNISVQLYNDNIKAQANDYFHRIFKIVKRNPFHLCCTEPVSEFGQIFLLLFNSGEFSDNYELLRLAEMSYFLFSKGINESSNKYFLIRKRLSVLYIAEDYLIDLLGRVFNIFTGIGDLKHNSVQSTILPLIECMRISDLNDSVLTLPDGYLKNQCEFFIEKYSSEQIEEKVMEGHKLHKAVFDYLFNLYHNNKYE